MKVTDYNSLLEIVLRNTPGTHSIVQLGEVAQRPICLVYPSRPDFSKKNVLVVAGFHGEESAGPWGLCKYVAENGLVSMANVSVIPVVNPDGFSRGTRYNSLGEVSNHNFDKGLKKVSSEGRVLVQHLDLLKTLARDGFLSLHENHDFGEYFFYLMSKKKDVDFRDGILDRMRQFFPIQEDGSYENKHEGKYKIKDGWVFNHKDDSFEQFLFDRGIPVCMTSETPMLAPFGVRVAANAAVMDAFIALISDDGRDWAGYGLEEMRALR